MLVKQRVLKDIRQGRITLAFRRWKRPTVKRGGHLRTAIGVFAIDAVELVGVSGITNRDAQNAGYGCKDELLAELNRRQTGQVYRIALHYVGPDPHQELRLQSQVSDDAFVDLKTRMARMDARSRQGPWTVMALELIAAHPEKRATELAELVGMETKQFKNNVRKLKELGLTESLKVGYRLSPRGAALFKRLKS